LSMMHHQSKWQFFLDDADVGDFTPKGGMNPFKQEKHQYTVTVPPVAGVGKLEAQIQLEWAHSHWKYTLRVNNVPVECCWCDKAVAAKAKPLIISPDKVPEVYASKPGNAVNPGNSTSKCVARFRFTTDKKTREVAVMRSDAMWEIEVDQDTKCTVSQPAPGVFGTSAQVQDFDKTFEVTHMGKGLEARAVKKGSEEKLEIYVNDVLVPACELNGKPVSGVKFPEVLPGDEVPARPAPPPPKTSEPAAPKEKQKTVPKAKKAEQPGFCCGAASNKDTEIVTNIRNQCFIWGEEVFME